MGDSKLKGTQGRLIQVPGYNIHPQYDLVHTRHILTERKKAKKTFQLSLAPMVDMFSILVIYLLMNFSSSGEAFFVSQDIVIPKAKKGAIMQSLPLISIARGKVFFDKEAGDNGQQATKVEEETGEQLPRLREALQQIKKIEEQLGAMSSLKGQVNIQADEKTPIEEVKRVMRVLIDEGWTGINFIVDPSK